MALPHSDAVEALLKKYNAVDADYADGRKDMEDALKQADPGAADVLELEVRPLLLARQDILVKLMDVQRGEAETIYEAQIARYKLTRMVSLIALGVGLLIAVLMAITLSRSILNTLAYAGKIAREIAQGKLGHDIQVNRKDELGRAAGRFPHDGSSACPRSSARCATVRVQSAPRRSRSPTATTTSASARRSRPPAWRKPPRRWRR